MRSEPSREIHIGCSCVSCYVDSDLSTIKCDQGRSRPYGEDGAPEGTAIGGLLAAVLIIAAAVGVFLMIVGAR